MVYYIIFTARRQDKNPLKIEWVRGCGAVFFGNEGNYYGGITRGSSFG
jgi:hypothetical protein